MKSFTVAIFIASVMAVPAHAEWDSDNSQLVEGSWENKFGLTYRFDAKGVMFRSVIDGNASGKSRYAYKLVSSGSHDLVKYGSDLGGTAETCLLMVTDLTDSTATIAHGLAFARADSGTGLKGEWLHVDDLSLIRWQIDHESVTYRQEKLDLKTGEYAVLENRTGTFRIGHHMDDAGRLYVKFTDGTSAVVFPLLFHDVMYLFDFSKKRSSFSRVVSP